MRRQRAGVLWDPHKRFLAQMACTGGLFANKPTLLTLAESEPESQVKVTINLRLRQPHEYLDERTKDEAA